MALRVRRLMNPQQNITLAVRNSKLEEAGRFCILSISETFMVIRLHTSGFFSKLRFVVIVATCAAAPQIVKAQLGGVLRAVRIDRPITVDGRLTEAEWNQAEPVRLPYEVDPRENVAAPQTTEVRVVYTTDMLYVGFTCRDSTMTDTRAAFADRDKATPDDQVVLVLDTYGDHQRAYIFTVNPRGIQGDAMLSGRRDDPSFDAVWRSGAQMFRDGWTAELGIPFKSLRFPDRQDQHWVVLFGRQYPRQTLAMLSATKFDRDNPCLTCQGMALVGIEGVQSGSALDVLPYAAMSHRAGLRDEDDLASPYDRGRGTPRAGVGIKLSPAPDVVVEGVFNPDFSQIETDAAKISVNTTFALFYPERRPFFLEGADLYQTIFQQFGDPTMQIFYSRTINDPLAAAKVFGKAGGLSYGLIAAQDRSTSLVVPGEEESDVAETGRESQTGVARVRYDFGDESFVGALGSARWFGRDASHVLGGVDGRVRFAGVYSLTGGAYFSETKELYDLSVFDEARTYGATSATAAYDGERFRGAAGRLELSREARDYGFSLNMEGIQPAFQSQNGFIAATNRQSATFGHSYTFYPDGAILDRISIFQFAAVNINDRRVLKDRFAGAGFQATMKAQTQMFLGGTVLSQERYAGIFFDHLPQLFFNVSSSPVAALSFKLNGQAGRFIYRDGTPPEAGYGHSFDFETLVRFTDRFRVRITYSRARLVSVRTGELFYDGNIYQSLTVYQFSPEFSLRLIGQFDTFDHRASIYPLLSYRLNAFSALYLGSTHAVADYGISRGDWRATSMQYFFKVQYLLQM